MISNQVKEEIKAANDIVEVISEFQKLIKAGANYKGVCPFHEDSKPSMMVSQSKQIFKCFVCDEGGDVISYVQKVQNISYPQALEFLAKRKGIDIPVDDDPKERAKAAEREKYFNTAENLQKGFLKNRSQKGFAEYLKNRNIKPETAELFGLGLGTNGQFYNRITFPFYNDANKLIGFTGRSINWNKEDQYPKFLNSSESVIFHKNSILFGLKQAKKSIVKKENVFFVEGQNDVISLFQAGVENVVCGSGTALNELQIRKLNKFTNSITFLYDGDEAGIKAMLRAIKITLPINSNVYIINLPNGQDPDDFVQATKDLNLLPSLLKQHQVKWWDIITQKYPYIKKEPEQTLTNVKELCSYLELIQDKTILSLYLSLAAELFHMSCNDIKKYIKQEKKEIKTIKSGFQGLEEALKLIDQDRECELTFDTEKFINLLDEEPIILWQGNSNKSAFGILRNEFAQINIDLTINEELSDNELEVIKDMYLSKIKLNIIALEPETEDNQSERLTQERTFCDWYITYLSVNRYFTENNKNKEQAIKNACQVIVQSGNTNIAINSTSYAKQIGLGSRALNKIIKSIQDAKINTSSNYNQDQESVEEKALIFDLSSVPEYVYENPTYNKMYTQFGFYPLLNKKKEPVSYVFKASKGNGHELISDFYMEPLLHIYSKIDNANKRVIKLNHIHFKERYVSWQSNTFVNINKIQEKLICEGAFNFSGDAQQFKRIWNQMSYGFTTCTELSVFGHQPEGFWAFTNAIFHNVEGEDKIEYVDELGVVSHNKKNFFSPAFSAINLEDRHDIDIYRNDRYFMYKEPEDPQDKLSFNQWADLFNEVYKIESNGQWGIIFTILSSMRDWIFKLQKWFTTLFYIGPTSSGKSQVAESIRSLFCSPQTAKFNLNSGTKASFFIMMERNRNVPVIMEEYNDNEIDPVFFQALKSAIYDGEGKIKVKDKDTKTLDISEINAVPILLGQEAPQGDDGALANRVIICDVPYPENGVFSEKQIEVYEKLMYHQRMGLSNILVEILKLRPVIMEHYETVFKKELRKLKENINISATNTEGLTRITNAVCMHTTICYIVANYSSLELPFSYEEFFKNACDKIHKQMKSLSSTNKLTSFFETINYLITQKQILMNREYKVEHPETHLIKVNDPSGAKREVDIPNDTKLLYLQLSQIYPLYQRITSKKALNQLTLKNYFNSNKAYIGWTKSTRFTYYVKTEQPNKSKDELGNELLTQSYKMERKSSVTSAYVFNYNMLREQLEIDFERDLNDPNGNEPTNNGEVPF